MLYPYSKWTILMALKIKSFIHLYTKYLSTYKTPSSVLGDRDTMVSMTDEVLLFTELCSFKNILPILFIEDCN